MAEDEWLKELIRRRLSEGHDLQKIKNSLVEMGYAPELIDDYIKRYEKSAKPPAPEVSGMKKEAIDRKLLALAVLLGVIIVGIFLSSYFLATLSPESEAGRLGIVPGRSRVANIDPNKLEIISVNPNLIFDVKDWSIDATIFEDGSVEETHGPGEDDAYIYLVKAPKGDFLAMDLGLLNLAIRHPWDGDGALYFKELLTDEPNRKGIVVIHPIHINRKSFLAQNILLPSFSGIYLVVTIGNVAEYIGPCPTTCADSIIKIRILDHDTGNEEIIYEDVVDSRDGWKDVILDISDYAGKNIAFMIEGWAGGPCSDWCGEYSAVDKAFVGKLIK